METVSTKVLMKHCKVLYCNVGDIVDHIENETTVEEIGILSEYDIHTGLLDVKRWEKE